MGYAIKVRFSDDETHSETKWLGAHRDVVVGLANLITSLGRQFGGPVEDTWYYEQQIRRVLDTEKEANQ